MSLNKENFMNFIETADSTKNNHFIQYQFNSFNINNAKNSLYKFKNRSKNNLLIIIDGSSILSSAYYADTTPRITREGLNTNAILGALRNISSTIYFQKPTHLAITLDRTRNTFRVLEYEKYKANRKPKPEELKKQFKLFEEVLTNIGIPVFITKEGAPQEETYEADDYSATLVKMFSKDIPVIAVSRDSDYLQLIGKNSLVYLGTPKYKQLAKSIGLDLDGMNIPPNTFPYTLETLEMTRNMTPEQIVQYKALVGDTSDCIPGVPGIGPKNGQILLEEYKNIQNLYKAIDEQEEGSITKKWNDTLGIKSSKQVFNKLKKGRDMAYKSEKLGRMKDDIPLEISLSDLKLDINKQKWNREMARLEIKSLYLR